MENSKTHNKYINNINITFFALILLWAFVIFGLLPDSDRSAEYKAEYKANQERIAEITKTKEEEIATQKAIYEAHKKKVAEYDERIAELNKKNNALSILIGEEGMKLIPSASASVNGNGEPAIAEPSWQSEVVREVSTSVEQVEWLRMMDMFWLNGCRFTNSKHYIPRINADWFWYDYACIQGKSFSVWTPSDGWTIEKVGFDKNMGNYVIIKKGNFRIGFGHLVTSRQIGDVLNRSDIVGQTDMSGASTGMHVHIELWDGEENVSYEYMLGKPYQKKRVDSLLKDRGFDFSNTTQQVVKVTDFTNYDVVKESTDFIKKWEGLHLKAYWDYHGCSIGYGTRATNCDEVITETEAEERFKKILMPTIKRVQNDFPHLNPQQHVALISLAYNCDSGYRAVKEKGIEEHKNWCKSAGGKRLEGLVKRRAAEAQLLFN